MQAETGIGAIDVKPEEIITFPGGMPGFENLTRYKLFHEEGQPTVFWLNSVDDPDVQFTVADPAVFRVQYQITLNDAEEALLQLDDSADTALLVMLYRGDGTDAHSAIQANFLGPLVINTKTRIGLQKVLNKVEGFVTIHAD